MKTVIIPEIYTLGLHETCEVKVGPTAYFVTRVPGGWIYFNPRLDAGQMNTIFVPFNNSHQFIDKETKRPH